MQVVLIKRVPKLGYEHDVVSVKQGFAMNFLFPQKLAVPATPGQLHRAELLRAKIMRKMEAVLENAKLIAEKLKGVVLKFKKKTRGEKLYGSISEKDIVEAVSAQTGVGLKKDMVKMEHIKAVGEYKVDIELAERMEVTLKVVVEAEENKEEKKAEKKK